MSGKLVLYSCGGAGVNIASAFEDFRGKTKEGFSDIEPVYIDTSKSNLRSSIPESAIYRVGTLDGSGKVRAENHSEISSCILDILQQHRPGDLNIVVSSASGGSGSVIAPLLVSELLARGVPTVVFIIGTTSSRIEVRNSINTLKSYESIAAMRQSPVIASYHQNSETKPRSQVDSDIQTSIIVLSALFAKGHRELDSRDLANWLQYTKVSTHQPHLAMLDFYKGKVTCDKPSNIITIATISGALDDNSPGVTVEYSCNGFVSDDVKAELGIDKAVHAVISDGKFFQVNKELNGILDTLDEASRARISNSPILSDKDRPTATGLVL